jgi:hypothetical protein
MSPRIPSSVRFCDRRSKLSPPYATVHTPLPANEPRSPEKYHAAPHLKEKKRTNSPHPLSRSLPRRRRSRQAAHRRPSPPPFPSQVSPEVGAPPSRLSLSPLPVSRRTGRAPALAAPTRRRTGAAGSRKSAQLLPLPLCRTHISLSLSPFPMWPPMVGAVGACGPRLCHHRHRVVSGAPVSSYFVISLLSLDFDSCSRVWPMHVAPMFCLLCVHCGMTAPID